MKTFWDPDVREEICQRVERLSADAKPQWGKFSTPQMLAHVNDAMRMALGDLPCAPKTSPLRYWPLKQLIVYLLPWPKGVPTAPELLARANGAELALEQRVFRELAEQLARRTKADRWPEHPAFGALSHRAWGVLEYRHADHHLRQFGI